MAVMQEAETTLAMENLDVSHGIEASERWRKNNGQPDLTVWLI